MILHLMQDYISTAAARDGFQFEFREGVIDLE
jgi:hypothetical protein